jgi:hypothetical protein
MHWQHCCETLDSPEAPGQKFKRFGRDLIVFLPRSNG